MSKSRRYSCILIPPLLSASSLVILCIFLIKNKVILLSNLKKLIVCLCSMCIAIVIALENAMRKLELLVSGQSALEYIVYIE